MSDPAPDVDGQPAASDADGFVALYHRAFQDYGPTALWNLRALERPTPSQALAITRQLRTEGDMRARRLAEAIERACRAAL